MTVLYHLPEGFPRWKRLIDSPALNDLAYRILQHLLVDQPGRINAEALAARFGAGRSRTYAALRQLDTWGFRRTKRTSAGYGKFLHFWQVTDEPGQFPDWPPAAICPSGERESSQVNSRVGQRQTNAGIDPVGSSGSSSSPPTPPAVDRRAHLPQPPRRRPQRLPKAFDLSALPAEHQLHAADALALLEGACLVPTARAVLAPAVAAALADGWTVGDLGHYLTQGMGSARDKVKVMRWRLRQMPSLDELTPTMSR